MEFLQNMSERARMTVFAVMVGVLALVFVLLNTGDKSAPKPRPTATSTEIVTAPAPGPTTTPASPHPTATKGPDAASLPLPVTNDDLNRAAGLAVKFVAQQNTYSWNMNVQTWMNSLTALTTTDFAQQLQLAAPDQGQIADWTQVKQRDVATAKVASVYSLSQNSITLIVNAGQTEYNGSAVKGTGTQAFSVTVTRSSAGDSWAVSNVQAANDGDYGG